MVTNNGFLEGFAFDGFRQHLSQDFDQIYYLNLKGDAHTSGELRRREGGNIFSDQIRVGIGITLLIRTGREEPSRLLYHEVSDYWRAEEKKRYLNSLISVSNVGWKLLTPDTRHTWRIPENADEYVTFLPIGSKETKSAKGQDVEAIFKTYSLGVSTNRDDVVYDFDQVTLTQRIEQFCDDYNAEVDRYKRKGSNAKIDDFIDYSKVKWSNTLKGDLQRGTYAKFIAESIRKSLYRPFISKNLYYASGQIR